MLHDDLQHSYPCNHWLGKRIQRLAGILLEHLWEGPHPRHREQNHSQEMRRCYDCKVYPRVPADRSENTRYTYPAV